MGLLGSAVRLAAKGVGGTLRSPIGRAAIGGIGGAITAYKKGYDRPEDILRGAAVGAAAFSILPTKAFWTYAGVPALKAAGRGLFGAAKFAGFGAYRVSAGRLVEDVIRGEGERGARLLNYFAEGKHGGIIGGLTSFFLHHPTLSMAAGSIGFIGYRWFGGAGSESSAVGMAVNYTRNEGQESVRRFANSTQGLVQGLHSGRHGGYF